MLAWRSNPKGYILTDQINRETITFINLKFKIMKSLIEITKTTKMSSGIGNSNPTVIGESTENGKRVGLIYQMFYNQHSVVVEIEGVRDTEAKRDAIKIFVKDYLKK